MAAPHAARTLQSPAHMVAANLLDDLYDSMSSSPESDTELLPSCHCEFLLAYCYLLIANRVAGSLDLAAVSVAALPCQQLKGTSGVN